jgi:YfiH family protein
MYKLGELSECRGLFHAFSTKSDGNMANSILGRTKDFEKTLINRKNFLKNLGIPIEKCICMWVLGADGVEIADPKDAGVSMLNVEKAVKTDALIANRQNLYLFLLIADCAPVILFDKVRKVVGIVHSGWKGADLNICDKTVKKLEKVFGTNPKNLVAAIGPAARAKSFIKEDPVQEGDYKWEPFISRVGGSQASLIHRLEKNRYSIDFVGLIKKQLKDSGLGGANILDCGIDTAKDKRFFSHVREKDLSLEKQGRYACIVGLK